MKIIGTLVLAIIVFLVAIIIPLAVGGKLNGESIGQLLGREEEPTAPPKSEDDVGPLAAAMTAERERLTEWAADLTEVSEQLDLRERSIDDTLRQVTEIQELIQAAMDELDAEQEASLETIAKTLAEMDPLNAATDLAAMTPEEAAKILPLIKDKDRGKILDEMEEQKRSMIIQVMQERRY